MIKGETNMFENIGAKLKTFARVLFVIMLIGAIAGGLTLAITTGKATASACSVVREISRYDEWDGDYYTTMTREDNGAAGFFAGAGVFILVAGAGIVSAWISSMFIYAYGQMVEDTETNRETNQENQKLLKKILSGMKHDENGPERVKGGEAAEPEGEDPLKKADETPLGANQMRCPYCGAVQPKGRSVCWECGKPLTADEPKPRTPGTIPERWTCPKCGTINNADARYCLVCGEHAPRPEAPKKPEPVRVASRPVFRGPEPSVSEMKPDTTAWNCPKCENANEANARYCSVCGQHRP